MIIYTSAWLTKFDCKFCKLWHFIQSIYMSENPHFPRRERIVTRKAIRKGSRIIEYKGSSTSWKEASHLNGTNGYIFYQPQHVLDAATYPKALGRPMMQGD
jgi:hypothetical protein